MLSVFYSVHHRPTNTRIVDHQTWLGMLFHYNIQTPFRRSSWCDWKNLRLNRSMTMTISNVWLIYFCGRVSVWFSLKHFVYHELQSNHLCFLLLAIWPPVSNWCRTVNWPELVCAMNSVWFPEWIVFLAEMSEIWLNTQIMSFFQLNGQNRGKIITTTKMRK